MPDERLEVSVSFDEQCGYVASADGLPTITALALAVARRHIKERLIGGDLDVKLVLDHAARPRRPGAVVLRRMRANIGTNVVCRWMWSKFNAPLG